VLGGATIGNEEPMILDLLRARPADAVQLIRRVGWRWFWEDLGGDNCRAFVREFGPAGGQARPMRPSGRR
jgi:hypothetical protein